MSSSNRPAIHVPLEVVYTLRTLHLAGFDAYLVGGAVRDLLRRREFPHLPITDFDFTTNATPEQILALFPEGVYENTFGTVIIGESHIRTQFNLPPKPTSPPPPSTHRIIDVAKATKIHISLRQHIDQITAQEDAKRQVSPPYQITTYRSDGLYSDHRRPDEVSWGTSLEDDLARRDFTINALGLQLNPALYESIGNTDPVEIEPTDYVIVDPFDGEKDLQAHIIATVGRPADRFSEDALRMLRAIRFAVQLDFAIEQATYASISPLAPTISHVSAERVRDELLKMLVSTHPKRAIELLDETGLLAFILPELLDAKGVAQGGHHTTDVWTHSLDALEACPSRDPIVRLATLLHDIAKPATYRLNNGTPTFYNHEIVGSRMAKKIGQRLKLSNRDLDRLFLLVRYHMFHYQEHNTDASVRRFMRQVSLENIDDILDLREGDRLGSGARKTSWRLEEFKARMIEQLHQPMDVTDLAINGTDLMQELQLQPGPVLGMLLRTLFEEVLDNPELNNREALLKLAQGLLEAEKTRGS